MFAFYFSETQTFVDRLFEAVNAKSYLPQPEQPTPASRPETHQRTEKDEAKREEVQSFLNATLPLWTFSLFECLGLMILMPFDSLGSI